MMLQRLRVVALLGAAMCVSGSMMFAPDASAQGLGGMVQGAGQNAVSGAANGAMGGMSGMSGMGNMAGMGSMGLPSLSSASSGNIAGVLGYCVQNNLLSGAGASSTLSQLSSQPSITRSSGYSAGQQGVLQAGNGNQLSVSSLSSGLKTKLCSMVLSKSQSML